MKKPRILCSILFCFSGISQLSAAEKIQLRPAVEMSARGGLPNFFAKLEAGKEVRVGYLGGSITAAPGWRVKSLAWMKATWPQAKLSEINAAIGGTGSDLGVFRAQQDVILHQPDLLFVEFAVNDGGASPDNILRAMEGIVRQMWKVDPNTDICFVYTLSLPMLKNLQDGVFPRAASTMEAVADHYGIPTIHFGVEVEKRVTDGKLIFKGSKEQAGDQNGPAVFSTDGVHPGGVGHGIYQEVIARSFVAMNGKGEVAPHDITSGKPLRDDHWEAAKIVPITDSMLKGKWSMLDPGKPGVAKDFSNRMPVMWKAEEAGASLQFIVNGSMAKVYGLVGPDGGALEIKVGDTAPRASKSIDGYCIYHRLATLGVLSSGKQVKQTISVTLTNEKLDKSKILFEKNRADLEKNSAKYAGSHWYAGSLLILGDLAE